MATQTKALVELTEDLRNNQLQIDQITEIENASFQKLQMCAPINYSKKET